MNLSGSTGSASAPASPGTRPKPAVRGEARVPAKRRQARIPEASREAKQRAAAILEVLAGVRTPADAAGALGVSLPRYYLLEERALAGLVQACAPQAQGRVASPESQRAQLERECARLERECARQQALVRAAQRTIGLAAPAPAQEAGRKRRRRKPVARALKAVAGLRHLDDPAGGTETSTEAAPAG